MSRSKCVFASCSLLLATVASVSGQLSFHNDQSQNSFQIRTPGFQHSFTRYFNGQQGSLFAAQQQNPQTPQYAPLPQTYAQNDPSYYAQQYQQQQQQQGVQQQQQPYSRFTSQYSGASAGQPQYTSVQDNYINPNIRLAAQQQRLLQQQQLQQQQQQQYQPQQAQPQQAQQQPQQQYYSPQDVQAYLQSQQAQLYGTQQQPQPQQNPQSQYEYIQQQQQLLQQQQQQQQQLEAQQQQQQESTAGDAASAAASKLIGVAFSPSNEVSQVKYSSNGLKYNF